MPYTGLDFSATVTTSAECYPRWYSDGELIKEGKKVKVKTSGTITLSGLGGDQAAVTCQVNDQETIENASSHTPGTDSITKFKLSDCVTKSGQLCSSGSPKLKATGLPWASQLSGAPPVGDEISGISLEVKCPGAKGFHEALTGTLTPTVGDSVLEFTSASGELTGPSGSSQLTGADALEGPKGDTAITAGEP